MQHTIAAHLKNVGKVLTNSTATIIQLGGRPLGEGCSLLVLRFLVTGEVNFLSLLDQQQVNVPSSKRNITSNSYFGPCS